METSGFRTWVPEVLDVQAAFQGLLGLEIVAEALENKLQEVVLAKDLEVPRALEGPGAGQQMTFRLKTPENDERKRDPAVKQNSEQQTKVRVGAAQRRPKNSQVVSIAGQDLPASIRNKDAKRAKPKRFESGL